MKSVMKNLKGVVNTKKIKSFLSDRENVIILCLSLILIILVVNYFRIGENYQNLDNVQGSEPTHELILFWVEWCPYCTKFIGSWKKMENSNKLIKIGNSLVLIKNVNCTGKESELPKKYGLDIDGFPYISLHKRDTKKMIGKSFNGPRNEENIMKWVKSLLL